MIISLAKLIIISSSEYTTYDASVFAPATCVIVARAGGIGVILITSNRRKKAKISITATKI